MVDLPKSAWRLPGGGLRKGRRCQAKSKGTADQCLLRAREGFRVCHMHGAGTRVRVERGERKAPETAALVHGREAKRLHRSLRQEALERARTLDALSMALGAAALLEAIIDRMTDVAEYDPSTENMVHLSVFAGQATRMAHVLQGLEIRSIRAPLDPQVLSRAVAQVCHDAAMEFVDSDRREKYMNFIGNRLDQLLSPPTN